MTGSRSVSNSSWRAFVASRRGMNRERRTWWKAYGWNIVRKKAKSTGPRVYLWHRLKSSAIHPVTTYTELDSRQRSELVPPTNRERHSKLRCALSVWVSRQPENGGPFDIILRLPSKAANSISCPLATVPDASMFCTANTTKFRVKRDTGKSNNHLHAVFSGTRTSWKTYLQNAGIRPMSLPFVTPNLRGQPSFRISRFPLIDLSLLRSSELNLELISQCIQTTFSLQSH